MSTGQAAATVSNNSNESSPSNSISLIKLDELSSYGATKQSRLPALIKLAEVDQNSRPVGGTYSMPDFSASQLEKSAAGTEQQQQQRSLPVKLAMQADNMQLVAPEARQAKEAQQADKENLEAAARADESDDFQVVDMQDDDDEQQQQQAGEDSNVLIGPSLPHVPNKAALSREQLDKSLNALQSSMQLTGSSALQQQQLQSGHLGDSLIEMIINLRNENQNLVRALETNNEYVKERLNEFKRIQESSKKREAQFAIERAEFEHQIRKLQRQNGVLSERLKSMEAKLRDMKLEVSESLSAAHSSKASSVRAEPLYPQIDASDESFSNAALAKAADVALESGGSESDESDADNDHDDPHRATTMQVDVASGELLNAGHPDSLASRISGDGRAQPKDFANMSKAQLEKQFDAQKTDFYSIDDPMKQCDKLEQQLNDIGKRDYDICLLQQQLNIYRQDFRLERMEKLEAKIQIEKLKNDIDRLCLERLQAGDSSGNEQHQQAHQHGGRRISDGLGRFGHRLTKKAARQAAKAAKYAAKQAHLEEKAASALARVAAVRAAATAQPPVYPGQPQAATIPKTTEPQPSSVGTTPPGPHEYHSQQHHHHHGRHRHHRHQSVGGERRPRPSGIRSEVVNDLLSTANKAMLTGYKMASTHVNLALDKLSQYEQQQASQLEKNKQQQATVGAAPSAPTMDPPSID